jgi:putative membrane protein
MKNAHANPLAGAAAGAIGGLVASWVMVQFNHVLGINGVPEEERRRPHAHRRVRALPNESDATIADEPGSRRAASAVAEAVTGRPLTESQKDVGGPIAHYLFGAVVGAVYGAAAEVKPDTTAGFGLPFGATVWVTADEMGMPLLGLSEPPADLPWSRHASSFGSHLVYGVVVEAVRRAFRGTQASHGDVPWWEWNAE